MMWLIRLASTVLGLAAGLLALTPVVDRRRQRALRRTVADVCRIFAAHGIDYWCDFGTLLGFYRDGDIIRSDKDADLSIFAGEQPRIMALADTFRTHGYELTDQGGRARKLLRIIDARTRYYVDIYPYIPDGTVLRSVWASPQEDIPLALVARRVSTSFLGAPVTVPADVPAVLHHRYGPSYVTPRRGDKGATRPYSLLRSVFEDLQDNVLGLWYWVRASGR
jgi:hypothetical protein